MVIGWHAGDRSALRPLFALAEDSPRRLEASLALGRVLVARDPGRLVGCLQLVDDPAGHEIHTLAVAEDRQGRGIGRALVERTVAVSREEGVSTLTVATGAADTGLLRFYQRLGFRFHAVERDAFTPADGYPAGLHVDGIPLRDRVWLTRDLAATGARGPLDGVQVRVARHTDRLEAVAGFYRDGLGLREAGRFRDHAGYDGVFLEIPRTRTHLELTSGGVHGAPAAHPESLLVLYLGDEAAVRAVAARLPGDPVAPANPYWAEHGLTFADPDGFRVVLVPDRWAH